MTNEAGPDAAEYSTRTRPSVGTALLNASAFIAALILVCAVIRLPIPVGEVPGSGYKYRFFSEHKDEFDLVFLGSSRVFHHFVPKQFDEELATRIGGQIRAFNFGYDAMWPPESFYMLRQVLALRPARLRWVLIDLMQVHPKIDTDNQSTLRIAYWHDLRHTALALLALKGERLTFGEKAAIAGAHIEHMLNQWTNRGRSAEWLSRVLHIPEKKRPKPREWETTGGFEAGGDKVMAGAELEEFHQSVDRLRRTLRPGPAQPVLAAEIEKVVTEVRAIGAEPIFVLAPTLDARENVTELPGNVRILSFANPDEFPALYDPANHYDGWHLNEKGARIFTRLLAERFSALLNETGTQQPQPALGQ